MCRIHNKRYAVFRLGCGIDFLLPSFLCFLVACSCFGHSFLYFHSIWFLEIYSFWMLWTSVNSFASLFGKMFYFIVFTTVHHHIDSNAHIQTLWFRALSPEWRPATRDCAESKSSMKEIENTTDVEHCNIKMVSKQMRHYIKLRNAYALTPLWTGGRKCLYITYKI